MLKDGSIKQVKQLAFEIHNNAKNKYTKNELYLWWSILSRVENMGFQVWNWFPNMYEKFKMSLSHKAVTPYANLHYINVNFL